MSEQPDMQKYLTGGAASQATRPELALVAGHCASAAIQGYPHQMTLIPEQGTLNTTQPEYKPGQPQYFEYAEHRFLGDSLHLQGHDIGNTKDKSAKFNPLKLENGLELTYGEICGLAGDFFAANEPISVNLDLKSKKHVDQQTTFLQAFDSLARGERNKEMAKQLIDALKAEVKMVDDALKEGKSNDISKAYTRLVDETAEFEIISKKAKESGDTYLGLAMKNIDHFRPWSRIAYNAGHAAAISEAAKGGESNLLKAYAMNAFADHFLEDSFASGHLRVPRDKLLDGKLMNALAKLMHDEDSRLGVCVSNNAKTYSWTLFGDKHLFDDADKQNREQLYQALKNSVDEIYEANQKKKVIPEANFKAWDFAASDDSLLSMNSNPAPLLKVVNGQLCHRKDCSLDISKTNRADLVKPDQWTGYTPVGAQNDLPEWALEALEALEVLKFPKINADTIKILSTAWFAYNMSPPGTMESLIRTVVEVALPWSWVKWIIDKLFPDRKKE